MNPLNLKDWARSFFLFLRDFFISFNLFAALLEYIEFLRSHTAFHLIAVIVRKAQIFEFVRTAFYLRKKVIERYVFHRLEWQRADVAVRSVLVD